MGPNSWQQPCGDEAVGLLPSGVDAVRRIWGPHSKVTEEPGDSVPVPGHAWSRGPGRALACAAGDRGSETPGSAILRPVAYELRTGRHLILHCRRHAWYHRAFGARRAAAAETGAAGSPEWETTLEGRVPLSK